MKDFVVATCKDSYGHLVIIELFETIDDTVLMQKSVLAVIFFFLFLFLFSFSFLLPSYSKVLKIIN